MGFRESRFGRDGASGLGAVCGSAPIVKLPRRRSVSARTHTRQPCTELVYQNFPKFRMRCRQSPASSPCLALSSSTRHLQFSKLFPPFQELLSDAPSYVGYQPSREFNLLVRFQRCTNTSLLPIITCTTVAGLALDASALLPELAHGMQAHATARKTEALCCHTLGACIRILSCSQLIHSVVDRARQPGMRQIWKAHEETSSQCPEDLWRPYLDGGSQQSFKALRDTQFYSTRVSTRLH